MSCIKGDAWETENNLQVELYLFINMNNQSWYILDFKELETKINLFQTL